LTVKRSHFAAFFVSGDRSPIHQPDTHTLSVTQRMVRKFRPTSQ